MTERRRSTDHPANVRSRRCVISLAVFAALAVALAFAAAGFALWRTAGRTDDVARVTDQLQHEATVRNSQFCHLINATHADRVNRYRNTLAYLRSPASRSTPTLNKYIRKVSLPQSREEIRREASLIPETCRRVP